MALLDPERGEQRRTQARAQLEAYRRQSNDLLDQTTRTVARQARDLLARTRMPYTHQPGPGEVLLLRVRQIGITKGLLMLGCAGLGAGVMYLLEPSVGKRRRALVRDKAMSYLYRTGDLLSQTARDMGNRTRGVVSEAHTRLTGADVPDDAVLVERVKAQIGHVVSHAGAISVTAHQGCVMLSGPIPAHEAEKLLSTVGSVAGVTKVVNQLEVHKETAPISGLQNGKQ
jgi:hypothetical protein